MWCDNQFAAFNEKIKLDRTREGRIMAAVKEFIDFSANEEELKIARASDPFLQGSVPTRTVIRPLSSDEFDVDVVYPFRLGVFALKDQRPAPIFNWFVSRLETSEFYKKRMIKKSRCVRIQYAGDFHMDLIPSTTEVERHQPYAVPARDLNNWLTSDPLGFIDWVQNVDIRSGDRDGAGDGVFLRCVRYVKRWRDTYGEEDFAPSVLLVTILGKHEASNPDAYSPQLSSPLYPSNKHDAAYLHDLLRLTLGCIRQAGHGAFIHPTIPCEDLAAGLSQAEIDRLINRLEDLEIKIRSAISAGTEAESVAHYRAAFGDSFPA